MEVDLTEDDPVPVYDKSSTSGTRSSSSTTPVQEAIRIEIISDDEDEYLTIPIVGSRTSSVLQEVPSSKAASSISQSTSATPTIIIPDEDQHENLSTIPEVDLTYAEELISKRGPTVKLSDITGLSKKVKEVSLTHTGKSSCPPFVETPNTLVSSDIICITDDEEEHEPQPPVKNAREKLLEGADDVIVIPDEPEIVNNEEVGHATKEPQRGRVDNAALGSQMTPKVSADERQRRRADKSMVNAEEPQRGKVDKAMVISEKPKKGKPDKAMVISEKPHKGRTSKAKVISEKPQKGRADESIVIAEEPKKKMVNEVIPVYEEPQRERVDEVIHASEGPQKGGSDSEFESKPRFKRKTENKCLNVSCQSGDELGRAPSFVLGHYGCNTTSNKRELVCSKCFDIAAAFQEKLAGMLAKNEPLFACDGFPINDIDVVDLESDEEIVEEEPPLPLSFIESVGKQLEKVLEDTLKKIDLDFQISSAEEILSKKLTELEARAKEAENDTKAMEQEIDSIRAQVYKDFEPTRKELPPIDITDCYAMESPFLPPPQPRPFLPTRPHQPQQFGLPAPIQTVVSSGNLHPQVPQTTALPLKKVTSMTHNMTQSQSELISQDIVALEQVQVPQTPLPRPGNLLRPKPRKGDAVYVMKMSFFGVWAKGIVMDVTENTGSPFQQTLYKVKMETQGNRKQFSLKTVTGRHLAYPYPAPVRLVEGTRVIAVFQDDDSNNSNKGGAYYSGLIAEPPKSNNKFRYLVFFDDGYAQYVTHEKILVVCESSRNVWDDIHPDSREFIRKYLEQYPERPMVKLAPNQVVKTEWNGKWWIARVIEVDGSLVKMSFDADKRTEWIYRGSTRLAPLFNELAHAQARQESGTISRMRGMGVQRKSNQPYVEYTQNSGIDDESSDTNSAPAPVVPSRAVAKKSTAKKIDDVIQQPLVSRPLSSALDYVGITKEIQLQDVPMPKRFQPHQCNPMCIEWTRYNPEVMRGRNPLSIPLFCGWQRELGKYRKKSVVLYTAPCGRRLRSMEDLHRYLRICKSIMSVDLFDFDYWVNALSEFTLLDRVRKHITQEDISYQKENVPIPLVNYVDNSLPSKLIYSTDRKPFDGVPLNLDPEFLCGCDCTDDCQDKQKCACWQLTIQGSALCSGGVPDPNVGYYYKRLQERVITGIYECNSQCKCSRKTCLNRVVQHPLQLRLQLFKTETKGWGLRCLNDIPKGTFICIYAGYLYTEATANQEGNLHGDEYLAELDYIEVVERMKEDYESDVEDDFVEDGDDADNDGGDDDDYEDSNERRNSRFRKRDDTDKDYYKKGLQTPSDNAEGSIRSRLRKRTSDEIESSDDSKSGNKRRESNARRDYDDDSTSDDEKQERLPSSFTPKPLKTKGRDGEPVHRFQSVRKFYGPNERVYIMDANRVGNIGRYLNHSCNPNVFVQNVFVDTHDLRFPWVAFFALSYIKAGKELTWDYNYDVGSVPDKQIICQCGSLECRGRLL